MTTPYEWDLAKPEKPKRLLKTSDSTPIPHSTEAEQGILGCLILDPQVCLPEALERLHGGPEAFYDLRHQTVYEVMLELYQASRPIELITVMQILKDRQLLEGVGGLEYLAGLPDTVPSAANLDYYLEIVNDKKALRDLINTCTEVVSRAYEFNSGGVDELMEELELDFAKTLSRRKSDNNCVMQVPAVHQLINDLEGRVQRQGTPSGVVSGFTDLDHLTDGLQYGEQFIIGARPSIGKTAFGLNLFKRACLMDKVPTLFISLEQSAKALMRRLASSWCRINMGHLKRGTLTAEEMASLTQFNLNYRNSPGIIYDFVSHGATAPLIASVIKRSVKKHGIKLVIIDYLQKVKATGKHEKRTYEVANVSEILRGAAVASNVAMVTLAQLNRENEKEKGRPPRLADLADSGQIERDADMVGLLHRDRSCGQGPATLNIAKQRDGETGIINLYFNGRYCEFTSGTGEQEL